MTFRNWRYDEERLKGIIENSPTALEAFNKAMKSIPQLANLREPIETAVQGMVEMAADLLAAMEYLNDCDNEIDRLRIRVRELEGMIIRRSQNEHYIQPSQPWPRGPDEPMCEAGAGTQAGPSPAPGSLS